MSTFALSTVILKFLRCSLNFSNFVRLQLYLNENERRLHVYWKITSCEQCPLTPDSTERSVIARFPEFPMHKFCKITAIVFLHCRFDFDFIDIGTIRVHLPWGADRSRRITGFFQSPWLSLAFFKASTSSKKVLMFLPEPVCASCSISVRFWVYCQIKCKAKSFN